MFELLRGPPGVWYKKLHYRHLELQVGVSVQS
jgi:hypothetical protein